MKGGYRTSWWQWLIILEQRPTLGISMSTLSQDNSDRIVTTPSLLTSTVHVATGIHAISDFDEWTTLDDHGRPVKKWTPLEASAGCYMVMYTRTDKLDNDPGYAFKSPESKEVIVRIMNKCGNNNPGLPRGMWSPLVRKGNVRGISMRGRRLRNLLPSWSVILHVRWHRSNQSLINSRITSTNFIVKSSSYYTKCTKVASINIIKYKYYKPISNKHWEWTWRLCLSQFNLIFPSTLCVLSL